MHKVASCFVGRSNSVRKTRPFAIMGDDSPDPTAVFQRTFWLGPNATGVLPSPIPEEFGPLNCGHSAAPAKLVRTTVARRVIQEARVIFNSDWDLPSVQVRRLDVRFGLYGLGIDRSVKPKRIAGSLCLVRQLTRSPFNRPKSANYPAGPIRRSSASIFVRRLPIRSRSRRAWSSDSVRRNISRT